MNADKRRCCLAQSRQAAEFVGWGLPHHSKSEPLPRIQSSGSAQASPPRRSRADRIYRSECAGLLARVPSRAAVEASFRTPAQAAISGNRCLPANRRVTTHPTTLKTISQGYSGAGSLPARFNVPLTTRASRPRHHPLTLRGRNKHPASNLTPNCARHPTTLPYPLCASPHPLR